MMMKNWCFLYSMHRSESVIRMLFGLSHIIYLIGHNNPIKGFRPVATHPSRRLCFLRPYSSWLHQLLAGTRPPTSATSNDISDPAQLLNIYAAQRLCRWGAHTAHSIIECGNHHQLTLDRRSYVGSLWILVFWLSLITCFYVVGSKPYAQAELNGQGIGLRCTH